MNSLAVSSPKKPALSAAKNGCTALATVCRVTGTASSSSSNVNAADIAISESAMAIVAELKGVLDGSLRDNLHAGYLVDRLFGECQLTYKQIAPLMAPHSYNHLCDLRNTYLAARSLPSVPAEATWNDLHQARKVYNKLSKMDSRFASYADTLGIVLEQKARSISEASAGKRPSRIDARQVRAKVVEQRLHLEKVAAKAKAEQILREDPSLAGSCFKGSCLDMLSAIEDGSVALLHLDGPYPGLTKCPGKGYVSGRGSSNWLRRDCAMQSDEDAINLITEVLRQSLRTLQPNGCLFLWLAGGVPDPWQIIKAAEEHGWACACCGYWKKSPQPGDFNTPWTCSTERFIVFCRRGEKVYDHVVGASRDQVIEIDGFCVIDDIPSVTRGVPARVSAGTEAVGSTHQYQKPEGLLRYIIERLTYPGELVVDLCGCSGSCAIAAATMPEPRRWMYCELDPSNFDFGVCRIAGSRAG